MQASSSCWNEEQHVIPPRPGWTQGACGHKVLAQLGAGSRAAGWAPSRAKGGWGPWSNVASGIAEAGRGQRVTVTKLSKWFR